MNGQNESKRMAETFAISARWNHEKALIELEERIGKVEKAILELEDICIKRLKIIIELLNKK